jgi:Protein of unknown function (DUF2946)
MRKGLQQYLSMVAIFAIALHTVLWAAVAPFATAAVVDPFTVICHSEASGPASQTPDHGTLAPAHACDHCNLCSATAPPAPPSVLAAHIRPARILQVLHPVNVARHDDIAANPKLARGPPALA